MLAAVGLKSIDELFSSIPERFRLREALNIPGPYSEAEVIQYFKDRAAENSNGYTSFLGAGVYNHLRSVVTDAISSSAESSSPPTRPIRRKITQGTLQSIFEFQTLMCQLTGQEVANASMYDGSTATTEAVLYWRRRLTSRRRVLVARSVHPEYRDVLKTYAKNSGLRVEEIPFTTSGTVDARALQATLKDDVAAVVVQSPNFFGVIEWYATLADFTHAAGAMFVVAIAEGVSLGLLKPPAEADIVAMEGQSFGLPPSYGGPFAGVIASRDKFVAANARAARGTNDGFRGPTWIRADARNTRAAHPPRECHFEHFAPTRRSARWPPRST